MSATLYRSRNRGELPAHEGENVTDFPAHEKQKSGVINLNTYKT